MFKPDQDDSATVTYGRYIHASQSYEIQWIDAIGSPHPTGQYDQFNGYETFAVSWWAPYKTLQEEGRRTEDIRLRGPKATTFPLTQGWKVDSANFFYAASAAFFAISSRALVASLLESRSAINLGFVFALMSRQPSKINWLINMSVFE